MLSFFSLFIQNVMFAYWIASFIFTFYKWSKHSISSYYYFAFNFLSKIVLPNLLLNMPSLSSSHFING